METPDAGDDADVSIPSGEDDTHVSIPRGGPIYVLDMVGPHTRVSDFESAVVRELHDLSEEVNSNSYSIEECIDDLSVEDLKVISEEDLVRKAFEVAHSSDRDTLENLNSSRASVDSAEIGEKCDDNGKRKDKKGGGRGRGRGKRRRANREEILDEHCLVKVEELVKIKQRQEEDKAAARLHSFSGCAIVASEKTERITSLKSMNCATRARSLNSGDHVPVCHPETVLCVEVYHSRRSGIKTQEFLVLGLQPLTELRDKIECLADQIMRKAGHGNPSGYFLIENVFYNDLRDPSAMDYSEPIRNWVRDSKEEALEKWGCILTGGLGPKQKELLGSAPQSELPQFRAGPMHKTRFCDLRFRLGAGYLYCHQGDCKHVIVIRDMRLIHPEDVQNRTAYPILTFQAKLRYRKCSVCNIYRAEKVTVDDKWAEENPCYFCSHCYYMLHYANGSLLYDDFSVYDYHHE